MGKSNLSIRRLLASIPEESLRLLVAPKVEDALEAAAFCRDWRNRRIAHRDLDIALERSVRPITPGSREKVRNALDRLADVLNAVSHKYLDSESHFDGSLYPGGAVALLHVLDSGADIEAKRRARIKRNEPLPEDYQRREV